MAAGQQLYTQQSRSSMTSHNSVIQGCVHTFAARYFYSCLPYGCRLGQGRLEFFLPYRCSGLTSSAGFGIPFARDLVLARIQNFENVCWLHALCEAIGHLCRCSYPVDTVSSFWETSAVRLPSPSKMDWLTASSPFCSLLS